jgi:signal transduction histidine kinase
MQRDLFHRRGTYDNRRFMSGGDQRMELLLEVTGALAAATSEQALARTITSTGLVAFAAAYGAIWRLDPDKPQLRLLAVSPLPRGTADRWRTVPLDGDAPLCEAVRTNTPIFLTSLDDYRARFPGSYERTLDTVASEDITYAIVPIAHDGPPIGALVITYQRANALGASDRALIQIVARQCALALQRIELAEAERAARFEAEEATRAREEILSVVSHDLRNPLGTIMMGVTTLQQIVDPAIPKADRILVIADRILRQSERMARLIEDLVDFAGIQAGKLSIERRPTAPTAIISAAAELFAPLAQERGVAFSVDVAEKLPQIDVDPERAVQVLSNLLANALKVTPKGGKVTLGASDGEVVFFVRDSGPGIDPSELPRLFERYWRSKKATYKGAGLGLSIARGIVDAHNGRIWAESQVGVGATFFFTLTPRS